MVVKGLPRGLVQNGSAVIRMGDRLRPQDLANLTFTPEPGFTGEAGSLRYAVDNGHGAVVESSIALDVTSPVQAADLVSQAELWDSIRSGGGAADRDAFLRLFLRGIGKDDPASRLLIPDLRSNKYAFPQWGYFRRCQGCHAKILRVFK